MNGVKISGLVLMGAFTLGVTSGSIVSATAGTEAVSGIAGEPQEDELTKLNNNGEDSINDGDNSEAETDADEDSAENKENIEGNLANGDNGISEKEKSGKVNAARIAGYAAGGIGATGALGVGAKFAYDEFAKAEQGEKSKSGSGEEQKGGDQNTKQDNNDDTKPNQNGTDPTGQENDSDGLPVFWIVVVVLSVLIVIVLIVTILIYKCKAKGTQSLDESLLMQNPSKDYLLNDN